MWNEGETHTKLRRTNFVSTCCLWLTATSHLLVLFTLDGHEGEIISFGEAYGANAPYAARGDIVAGLVAGIFPNLILFMILSFYTDYHLIYLYVLQL